MRIVFVPISANRRNGSCPQQVHLLFGISITFLPTERTGRGGNEEKQKEETEKKRRERKEERKKERKEGRKEKKKKKEGKKERKEESKEVMKKR